MFDKLRNSLSRTRTSVFGRIVNLLGAGEIDEDTWDDLEALLIQADVGIGTTTIIIDTAAKSGSTGRGHSHAGPGSVAQRRVAGLVAGAILR